MQNLIKRFTGLGQDESFNHVTVEEVTEVPTQAVATIINRTVPTIEEPIERVQPSKRKTQLHDLPIAERPFHKTNGDLNFEKMRTEYHKFIKDGHRIIINVGGQGNPGFHYMLADDDDETMANRKKASDEYNTTRASKVLKQDTVRKEIVNVAYKAQDQIATIRNNRDVDVHVRKTKILKRTRSAPAPAQPHIEDARPSSSSRRGNN